jgi:manganese transport protein
MTDKIDMKRNSDTSDEERSLAEINGTIEVPTDATFLKKLLKFSGPGALVAVGYMDPGNWVTSIGGGAQFGYLLLSVVLLSSLIAMLMQYLSAKLGIVTGLDLAQATRKYTGKKLGILLWVIMELAIVATDIAEVLGAAIALNLLFGMPIVVGVFLMVLDVFVLLWLMKLGFRKIEAIVVGLIMIIMGVFIYEVAIASPQLTEVLNGFMPQRAVLKHAQLTMALGIVGATVMPHNLYLGSSITQSRKIDRSDLKSVKSAVKFATWDSNIQLSAAFIVNVLLLVLGAAMFYGRGQDLGTLTSLYDALKDPKMAGDVASPLLATLFAIALFASGQSSTITGTLAGQIVMEGFVDLKVKPWVQQLITRLLAVLPVLVAVVLIGDDEASLDRLLVGSQVFLSLALPLSVVPLIYFTSSENIMSKHFMNRPWIKWTGWVSAIVLSILNIKLIIGMIF